MTVWPEALSRNRGALDPGQQQQLLNAHVVVCGCGGLGGQVVENLARIGIGRLTLFDMDSFAPSNLNRQLGALQQTMGKNKAETLAGRTGQIHDFIQVQALEIDFRATERFVDADVVVDCLDSVEARRDLAERCNTQNLPLVHGAVNGWYGQVGIQQPGGNLLTKLYPEGELQLEPPPVLAFTATIVASLQATETVKLLLGIPSQLSTGWLNIDLRACDFDYLPST